MDTAENQADKPADNTPAAPITPAPIENTSAQSEAQPAQPETAKHARLTESQLESAHAELPPLSSIPTNGNVTETAGSLNETNNETRSASARRGIGRGNVGKGSAGQARPTCGVVENPAEIAETLSGQFAGGYGDRPARPERPQRREHAPEAQAPETCSCEKPAPAAGTGPREFVPPVSQGVYKAEVNPERERQAREEKRRERGERKDAGASTGNPSRRDDRQDRRTQQSDWTPTPRADGKTDGKHPRQKLVIEPAKIPAEPEETFFTKVKNFFGKLFGLDQSASEKTNAGKNDRRSGGDRYRNDRGGNRGHYRGDRGHGRGRGGEFRHGNRSSGGNYQDYNRDGRRRPHSHGGNNRNDNRGGE